METSAVSRPVQNTDALVSLAAFHGINWACFGLCVLTFSGRLYVKYICFGRPLLEDYLMAFALLLLLGTAICGQITLKYIYNIVNVSNFAMMPGPNFISESETGLHGFGITLLFCVVRIWAIKLNFLIFFKRLGEQIPRYQLLWWIVLVITIGCGAASIGRIQYECLFDSFINILARCSSTSSIKVTYLNFKLSCALDVISDALIICFPIAVLWKVRISLPKKLILGGIFSLVAFTIAVTIVRGSIFGGVYKSIGEKNMKEMNITWMWFWFYIEFTVSFIISCLVSFRALFTQRERKQDSYKLQHQDMEHNVGSYSRRSGSRKFHDSVLDTCRSLEGIRGAPDDILAFPPHTFKRLSVNFMQAPVDERTPVARTESLRGLTREGVRL